MTAPMIQPSKIPYWSRSSASQTPKMMVPIPPITPSALAMRRLRRSTGAPST
jgi:hypothetical protein